jgi:hypothetical protein
MKGSQIKAALFRFRASASVDPAHRQSLLLSGSGERGTGYIKGEEVVPRGGAKVINDYRSLVEVGNRLSQPILVLFRLRVSHSCPAIRSPQQALLAQPLEPEPNKFVL